MEEFRKPYEYFEERRGVILIFIVMILFADIFLSLNCTDQLYNKFWQTPVLSIGFLVIGIAFLLFLLYTAVSCYKLKKNMVTTAKAYLIIRTVFMIGNNIILFIHDKKFDIGNGPDQYVTFGKYFIGVLLLPVAYDLVFGIAWYLYFVKSRKCREFKKRSIEA